MSDRDITICLAVFTGTYLLIKYNMARPQARQVAAQRARGHVDLDDLLAAVAAIDDVDDVDDVDACQAG